jgi:transcriptional regulator with XRE-family HTH domain
MSTPEESLPEKLPYPHLGKLIDHRLTELGMSKAEFGRRIVTSRQNVGQIIEKHSLSTDQLWRISDALGVDFFDLLSDCFRERTRIIGHGDGRWVEFCIRVDEERLVEVFELFDEKVRGLRKITENEGQ